MSLTLALLDDYNPIIHIPRELPNRDLIDVLYEIHNDYAVLWYHWPRDGFEDHEDYEPIILFFRGNELKTIAIRPHRQYRHYKGWTSDGIRPIILFDSIYHAPILFTGGRFDPLLLAYSKFYRKVVDYPLLSKEVPWWFIKDGT